MIRLIIIIILALIVYSLFYNYKKPIKYKILNFKTALLKKTENLKNLNFNYLLKIIDSILEFLQEPFMNYINVKFRMISKITSFFISFLSFVKEIILYFLKKK